MLSNTMRALGGLERTPYVRPPQPTFGLTPAQQSQIDALQGEMDPRRFTHLQQNLAQTFNRANGVHPARGQGQLAGGGGNRPGMPPASGPIVAPGPGNLPPGAQGNPALPPQPLPPQWQAPVNRMIAPPANMVGQRYAVAGLQGGASPYDMPSY